MGARRGQGQRQCASRRATSTVQVQAGKKVDCVGIVGCTGAVGREMLQCLEARDFPTEAVRLFAKRSAGTKVQTKFWEVVIEPFSVEAAQQCDLVLMAVSGEFSKEFSEQIRGGPKNTAVIDNSSAFRLDGDVPLVVPEINGGANSE